MARLPCKCEISIQSGGSLKSTELNFLGSTALGCNNGQKLAYVHFDDPRSAARPLTHNEARRIAANIAKLPELLSRRQA